VARGMLLRRGQGRAGADDQGHGTGAGRSRHSWNIVAPGIVLAGLSKVLTRPTRNFPPRATAAIPWRELAPSEQCADAFLFLASDESDYVTGISLSSTPGHPPAPRLK